MLLREWTSESNGVLFREQVNMEPSRMTRPLAFTAIDVSTSRCSSANGIEVVGSACQETFLGASNSARACGLDEVYRGDQSRGWVVVKGLKIETWVQLHSLN